MTGHEISGIFAAFNSQLNIVSSERLHSGLSNDNFLVRAQWKHQPQAYLLKCYRDHWPEVGLIAQADFAAQGICPQPLWTDKANKIAIFDYLEGDIAQGNYTTELLKKLVTLHGYHAQTVPMNINDELAFYQQTPLYQYYQVSIAKALQQIALFPRDDGFCHNDLVKENIIVNQQGMFLIDFEYAKSNDVYFDLAALVVSFSLDDKQKTNLLAHYQQFLPDGQQFYCSINKLECYQVVFLVLCICWYSARSVEDKVSLLRTQLDRLINRKSSN
ncbi:phosphotransferase [Pseudoalteromonas sp. KAN5]|uniref:phosphotransferase n=1 Tax=Pseudoalteromonas sp. KAN5 TaxID=2916633 RepID=UPI001FCBE32D|nr:phosphotransferase [Pseudoalteromonas sp. KAN5]BDF96482.1 hypothetical protein KAN5_33200 [Pseudoalteromonas sp. KAN5]